MLSFPVCQQGFYTLQNFQDLSYSRRNTAVDEREREREREREERLQSVKHSQLLESSCALPNLIFGH